MSKNQWAWLDASKRKTEGKVIHSEKLFDTREEAEADLAKYQERKTK